MLYYGDRVRTLEVRAALRTALGELARAGGGSEALVAAFVDIAELAQGAVDAEFATRGCDAETPETEFWAALLTALAQALAEPCGAGGAAFDIAYWCERAAALPPLARPVDCRRAEGYAFYAVYPQAYLAAGRTLRGVSPLTVIGIRSIGFGLAALVSAGAGAAPPVSVRPVGHPFQRALRLAPGLAARFDDRARHYAVVDEGPGLSGSSFGAVVDRLEAAEVPRAGIHLFPSHRGEPGGAAADAQRERWRTLDRRVVDFDMLFPAGRGPATWFADLAGAGRLVDISGGTWRRLLYPSAAVWPAANPQQERRKFLLHGGQASLMLKFAGLGRYGAEPTQRARILAAAGFSPHIAALRKGFVATSWHAGARPLRPDEWPAADRLTWIGAYLSFRARHFPATQEDGASLAQLGEMLVFNAEARLGPLPELRRFVRRAEPLQGQVVPVFTDNRLLPHEWLRLPDGRVLKTDAVDHSVGHDLVGAQDIAWDVAGAVVEFGLDAAEADALCDRIGQASGRPVARGLLDVLTPAYLAFMLGASVLAAGANAGLPDDAARLTAEADRYETLLRQALARIL